MEAGKQTIAVAATIAAMATATAATDAERNNSAMMNPNAVAADEGTAGGVKALFLGNSITLHAPLPPIGWTNNWGMAASSKENDYVHVVTRGIEEKTGRKAEVRVRNLAEFERDYRTYDIERNLSEEVAFAPDYLVIALGENVPNLATDDDRQAYRAAFGKLLGVFAGGEKRIGSVVRGVFWKNEAKDEAMSQAAKENGFAFVSCADLGDDDEMKAIGLFEHKGVAAHPGDKGMAAIADRILKALLGN